MISVAMSASAVAEAIFALGLRSVNSFLFQVPALSSATFEGIRRSSARINPIVNSATATEFLPGQFDT